jgi:transketolase C-terminal domain/subunit
VVTTPTNGAAEIIEEGQTGYILNGSQPLSQQITAKIVQFSRLSPPDRRAMAKRARKTAEKFTLENHVHHTIQQLSQL